MRKEFILIIALVILIIGMLFNYEGKINKAHENKGRLKGEITRIQQDNRVLKSKDSVLSKAYEEAKAHTEVQYKNVYHVKEVYMKAVERTDLAPDSLSLLNEVRIGRKLIVDQTGHINALLALSSEADKLIASKNQIIANQESELMVWSERLDNIIAIHEADLKTEKRKGNRKFFKGVGVGAAVIAVLVII